ncbi:uncharacterized protein [Vicugna pacos]|uniref:Transport and Golgi organization protein 1 homolog n=1 Tax=Vicugna pacos TaxID=30538 RepID=A0ABM5CI78_VICPA
MEVMEMVWSHVLGCTGYEITNILHTFVLLFHPGSDVYELLWKLILLAASWGVSSFLLFIWRTVFAVKPPVCQVNLKQMTEQIKNLENENRELAENISAWVQKTNNAKKCLKETIRQKMLSEKSLKFKENLKTIERVDERLNDIIQIAQAKLQAVRDAKSPHLPGVSKTRSEGSMQQAVTTEDCSLEESKKKMQDHHAASGSLKEREEDSFQEEVKKVRVLDNEISRQRTMDTEGKVDMNGCELVGKQRLLASEEKAKLAEEETREYKIKLEECHVQMREAEITWRHQVALAEKKAQDSSLRAQELERDNSDLRRDNSDLRRDNSDLRRDNSDQRREVAHLKQRLDAICRRRQAEEYMRQEPTPEGPYRLHPPLRASGPGGTSVRNGNAFPAHVGEEAQATPWAGEPQPFPGPVCVACPACGPSSPSWAPAPVPPWCPVPPGPPPPAAPLGGMSVHHFAEEGGGESSSEEEGATEPDLKKPEDATGTVETAPWEPTDHTTPTSSAGAHGAYYTPAHAGPGAAPMWPDSAWPPAAAQATPWAGGPQPFPGPVCVACPACGPSSPSWAPAPVPPWCPVPPGPPPPAAPLGGMSVHHFAEEGGGESSSEEEGATEPDLKKPEDATGTVETAPWEPTDHTTPTSSAGAHGAYYTPAHAGPGAAPMWPDSAWPPAAAQATPWAGGPQPFPGPVCVACPACGPSSPSWAPAPVPPWCPVPPGPPPPAAPLGGMSVHHFAEEGGGESSSEEEGATEPDLKKPEDATGTVETAPWEPTDHTTPTSSAGAHGAYYTPAHAGPGAAPMWPDSAWPPAAAQATPWAGGPQPFPGPVCVACPACGPSSPSWAPAPVPPWCPVPPGPPPPAAPLGGMSVHHFAEEGGGESSSEEEGATEPDLKKPEDATGTVETAPWEPTDHTTPTSSAGAHGAYYTPAHAGPGAAPMWPDSAWPPAAAQATPWAGGPQPFPGPVCVACPACGPSSPSWAPAPVPPWCPVPPGPPPPAAPLGGMSVHHFAEEGGGESSSEEEGATEPDLKKPEDATGTVETAPWEPTDHTTPTSSAGAHGAYYTPGHSEFQTSRCLSRTTWCTLPPGTPITDCQMLFITATPTSLVASVVSVTGTSYFARLLTLRWAGRHHCQGEGVGYRKSPLHSAPAVPGAHGALLPGGGGSQPCSSSGVQAGPQTGQEK